MKKNSFPFGLSDIGDLIDSKLEVFSGVLDRKFKINNEILLASFDRDIRLIESRIGNLEDKVDDFRAEVNSRFDGIDDRLNAQSERIKKVEPKIFAAV